MIMVIGVAVVIVWLLVQRFFSQRRKRRLQYLQNYSFHRAYFSALQADYPRLSKAEMLLAEDALRQFFVLHWHDPKQGLHMPSKLADALWHTFILDTRRYEVFCQQAFGHTFHHVPAYEMAGTTEGVRRSQLQATWNAAMRTKHLLPRALIAGVPVLVALDAHTMIDDGLSYSMRDLAYWSAMMRGGSAAGSGGCGGSNGGSGSSCSSSTRDYSSTSASDCDSSASSTSDGGSSCGGGSCGGGGGGD